MIEGDPRRQHLQILTFMTIIGQAVVAVEDIRERSNAIAGLPCLNSRLLKANTHEIAHSLRAVLVSVGIREHRQLSEKFFCDGDRNPSHRALLSAAIIKILNYSLLGGKRLES